VPKVIAACVGGVISSGVINGDRLGAGAFNVTAKIMLVVPTFPPHRRVGYGMAGATNVVSIAVLFPGRDRLLRVKPSPHQ